MQFFSLQQTPIELPRLNAHCSGTAPPTTLVSPLDLTALSTMPPRRRAPAAAAPQPNGNGTAEHPLAIATPPPPASVAEEITSAIWSYPLPMFMTAVCLWSWAWLAALARLPVEVRTPHMIMLALGMAGLAPSFVGLLFVSLAEGDAGFTRLRTQLLTRHNPLLWLAALAAPAVTYLAAAVAARLLEGDEVASGKIGAAALVMDLAARGGPRVVRALPNALGVGMGAAVGWWAFLCPHLMRSGNPPLKTGGLIGLSWAVWALPSHWLEVGEATPGVHGPLIAVLLSCAAVPAAVLITSLYLASRGSLPLTAAAATAWAACAAAFADQLQAPAEPEERLAFAAWVALSANVVCGVGGAVALWRQGEARRAAAKRREAAARRR